jgi:HEAT repeat protein
MSWADRFRWTSRTELCDQLLQYLFTTPPTPSREPQHWTPDQWNRADAARLLGDLKDESSAVGLARLLLDTGEEREVRRQALYGLRDLTECSCLSLSDLSTLLNDRTLWAESCRYPDQRPLPERGLFIALLSLHRGAAAIRLARSHLQQWNPLDRAVLLRSLPGYAGEPEAILVGWLYEQWLTHDRFQIEGVKEHDEDSCSLNLRVTLEYSDRIGARELLHHYWLHASPEERSAMLGELWCRLEEEVGCLALAPCERQEFAEELALPVAELIHHFGPMGFLDRIESSLRDASRAIAAARWPRPPSGWEKPGRALELLARWRDASANSRIASLCGCPDFHMVLRRELLEILWKRAPSLALVILRRAIVEPEFLPLAQWLLPCLCQRPRAEDREFFHWIIEQGTDPGVRYRAVEALERLGEDGVEWRQRLAGMTRSRDPYLRVRALGALARRGEMGSLKKVQQIARRAEHVCVRAEAIRVLGELDAERYVDLLTRALLEDHAGCGPCPSELSAAAEAAIALSRLGTPEALTALVRGNLTVPDQDLQSWIGDWLGRADEREHEPSIRYRGNAWGICRNDRPSGSLYRCWRDEDEEDVV